MKALTLFAAFAVASYATSAHAQSSCLPTQQVYTILSERHGEARVMAGIAADGQTLTEVWGNPDTGSFTVFLTNPGGTSCLALSGTGMQLFAPKPNL